jgi:DtxR family Mn-dependent transcriptional regulator
MSTEDQVLEFLFFWARPITAGNLRTRLEMKHSTLNSVLQRLVNKQEISWQKYGSIELTEKGREIASHLSNHHFVVEKFLVDELHLQTSEAHQEALALSPHISCKVIDAICDKLGVSHNTVNKSFCTERSYH